MPLESAAAVILLEARLSPRAPTLSPDAVEASLAALRAGLESPVPGRLWQPASDSGLSGRLILEDAAQAFPLVQRLRTELRADPAGPRFLLVAGFGRGEEIEASRLAANAFRSLGRKRGHLTCALTGNHDANVILNAFCRTLDVLQVGWTQAQWQAVHRRDGGATLQEIGRELGIAYQNVSKRLLAAKYTLLREVLDAAGLVFARADFGSR